MMYSCNNPDVWKIFPSITIMRRGTGQRAGKNRRDYINIISGFDIETTRIESINNSVMYIWQWHFYDLDTNIPIITIYGRTWQEYLDTCRKISDLIHSIPSQYPLYMVRLIHNLSYEFQFLSAFYE